MACAYSGFLALPWPLWLAQQAALLAAVANLEQDCSSAVSATGPDGRHRALLCGGACWVWQWV